MDNNFIFHERSSWAIKLGLSIHPNETTFSGGITINCCHKIFPCSKIRIASVKENGRIMVTLEDEGNQRKSINHEPNFYETLIQEDN